MVRGVRALVGPKVPIGLAMDMHGNMTRAMVDDSDVVTVYQTNPHIDAFEQAILCARLIVRTVRGQIHPKQAIVRPAAPGEHPQPGHE